jgi:tagaturonate reductase
VPTRFLLPFFHGFAYAFAMILQFGTGNFLRAFVDLFVEEIDATGSNRIGPVIAVQSTGRERADRINAAGGNYHVAIQGFRDGEVVDEIVPVHSIEKALHAPSEWNEVLEIGRHPELAAIVSNTTEAGLALDDRDRVRANGTPHSFPAKLLSVLLERRATGLDGPWIVPCELVEDNGDRLFELVLEQAALWGVDADTVASLRLQSPWVNTLVDRIVPGPPKNHPLLDSDPLLLSAEPFALWAIETERSDFPFAGHPAVTVAPDISSFTLRKVRILNGAHTALVCRAGDSGPRAVRDCLEHPEIGPWLEELLFEEIVPVLEGRCEDPEGFARDTLDRFRNPFLEHELSAIALHHEAKVDVRLRPTLEDYIARFGKEPDRLAGILA